jgi:processive 1,2-diacylglycerol beta-glucosyltransferase
MAPPRVLVLSASVGSGHKVAAAAVERVFRERDVEVLNQDALKLTSRLYQATAADAYFALVKGNPWAVGWLYDYNDEPFKNELGLNRLWNDLNAQPLARFIAEYEPDITVCTHFMPAGVAAQLLYQRKIGGSLAIVTTDFDFQGMWLSRVFSRYFVALDETKVQLAALGIDADRITVSGIPVSPALSHPCDCAAVRARFGLRDDLPTLLVSAGALGGGPAREIVAQIMRMRTPVQTVVVCGRNQALRDEVIALTAERPEHFRVLGFTAEMLDLMRVASLFIGKPGGLTSSECMAAGLPMLIVQPIPGQEERNSDHLLESGAAARANDTAVIAFKLDRLFAEPGRLEQMRAATARLGRPDAAAVVVDTLLRDNLAPEELTRDERRKIIRAARGAEPDPAAATLTGEVPVYNNETGVYLGAITPEQIQFLVDQLEEESLDDTTYYLDGPTLDLLARNGADPQFVAALRATFGDRDYIEIRYIRQS